MTANRGKVAVFGAGSWGTAFSIVLADAGNDVTIWGRREEVSRAIRAAPDLPVIGHSAGSRVSVPSG